MQGTTVGYHQFNVLVDDKRRSSALGVSPSITNCIIVLDCQMLGLH